MLGPLRFAVDAGHLRSALLGQAVDRGGQPLLWVTYPAIEFLRQLDWRGKRVLEWGAGNSTLWWAQQGASVFSVEHSQEWIDTLERSIPTGAQVQLRLARDADAYVELPRSHGPFDLVVIDGESRPRCAEVAVEVVAPSGGILLDNSEQSWAAAGEGFPIIERLHALGWRRVDFHGFAPSVARPHCTSLFFRPETRLFDLATPPYRQPGIVPG